MLTAVLGSSLVRSEGIKTLLTAQQKMQLGRCPAAGDGWHDAGAGGLAADYPGICERYCRHPAAATWLRNMLADKLIGSNQFRMQMGLPGSPAAV